MNRHIFRSARSSFVMLVLLAGSTVLPGCGDDDPAKGTGGQPGTGGAATGGQATGGTGATGTGGTGAVGGTGAMGGAGGVGGMGGSPSDYDLNWSTAFTGAGIDSPTSVAIDAGGNVIVAGGFNSTLDVSGTPLTAVGGANAFVAKLDANGVLQWAFSLPSTLDGQIDAVTTDLANNVLIAGRFQGDIDVGGPADLVSAGLNDVFVLKLDPSGNYVWAQRFGDADDELPTSIAVDLTGAVHVGGKYKGTIGFGGSTHTANGAVDDLFIAKLDAGGTFVWSGGYGTASADTYVHLDVDSNGNLVAVGDLGGGTMNLGGSDLTGDADFFVSRFGPTGTHMSSTRFGDANADVVTGFMLDGSDNLVLGGWFTGNLDFGGGALSEAGGPAGGDIFVATLSSGFTQAWSNRFGDANPQAADGVVVDALGNVTVGGSFKGTFSFGGGTLANMDPLNKDVFVVTFNSAGGFLASSAFGDATADETAWGLAVSLSGDVIYTGDFWGSVNFGGTTHDASDLSDIFVSSFAQIQGMGGGGMGGAGGAGGAGGMGGAGGAGGMGGVGGMGGTGGAAACGTGIACFAGGSMAPASGSGTCGDPYVVDMTGAMAGDVISYAVGGNANDEMGNLSSVCGIDWSNTVRDIVFLVQNMDATTTGLEISTDTVGGVSPMIAVAEDPNCGQPLNSCADDNGDNMCEALCAPRGGSGFFGTSTFVVISENTTFSEPFNAFFRIIQ